jgi:hypothetical protein
MKIRIIITPSPLFSDVSVIFQVMVLELPDPNIKLSIVAIWREHQHNSTYVIEDVFFFWKTQPVLKDEAVQVQNARWGLSYTIPSRGHVLRATR